MCHIRMVCACAIRQRMRLRLIIMVWTKYKSNSEKTENVLGSIGVNVNDAICVFLSIRLLLYFSLFLSLSNSLYDFVFMSSLQGAPLHNFRAYTKRASTANGQHASSGDTQSIVLVSVAFGAAQHLYMWPVQKDGGQVQSAELYLFTVHIGYITIYNLYNILNECIFLLAVVVVHYHGCMPFFSFLLVCSRLCCPIVIAHTHTRKEWRATMKENAPRRTTIKTEKKNAMHIAAPLCVALLQGTTARIAHNANDALRVCKAFGLCHAVLGSSLLRFCLPFCSPFLFHFILIRNFASRRT